MTIKKILDIISSIKKILYNQFKIGGDAMQTETLARFIAETVITMFLTWCIFHRDRVNAAEEKLYKFIGGLKR